MSVRDRIEDSRLLFAAGRLEGALLMVLTAIAGTSRDRYPEECPSKKSPKDKIGSGEAFVEFLRDEESRIPTGVLQEVYFEGRMLSIAEILWKFVRCDLSHEAQLHDKISVDYGDFLLDKRGSVDHITFSSELIIRLSYLVETAKENSDDYPKSYYDRLPEPIDLKRSAIIGFTCGDLKFECWAYACSIITGPWVDAEEVVEWLHIKAHQLMNGKTVTENPLSILVPLKFVTRIEEGPEFTITKRRTSKDVGIFPPDMLPPIERMEPISIRQKVSDLQIEMETSTAVQLRRPKC